jgi:hypothetical protein
MVPAASADARSKDRSEVSSPDAVDTQSFLNLFPPPERETQSRPATRECGAGGEIGERSLMARTKAGAATGNGEEALDSATFI